MKNKKYSEAPLDIKERVNTKSIICYPIDNIKESNLSILHNARKSLKNIRETIIPPKDTKTFEVKKSQFFRIESMEGPQVGDLNIFHANNLEEKFYPLKVSIWSVPQDLLKGLANSKKSSYSRSHGLG